MAKYTLKSGQQGEKNLFIDGLQSVCPFVPAIPFQGNMGQVQLMRMPCCTLCPLAELEGDTLILSCGSEIKKYLILEEKDSPTIDSSGKGRIIGL